MRLVNYFICCLFFSLILPLLSCKRGHDISFAAPPTVLIKNFDPLLRKVEQIWLYKSQPFSGFMVEIEHNKILYKLPIIYGKENGLAIGWYNTGEKLMERFFVNGKKESAFRQWWPNGNLRYLFNFKNDVYNGKQQVFFPDGSEREESNYTMGKLDGQQKVWNEEHEIISNYTIRSGKIYGLRAVKSCMPVAK
jgi:antitoxin component YwqK of YwqJK toxin-antitoxin module